ncbi:MAG TPA: fasciclin domain-containing protein [Chitinophagaceae bacterium]|nr:fasciclin domain-containing protein [Chitinophagaceae bacterium]
MATILQITNADRNLSHFSRGLKLAGLEEKLNEIGPFTLLGPVNLAFGKIEINNTEQLFLPANKNKLIEFLSYHILLGKKMMSDFGHGRKLKTLDGRELTVSIVSGDIYINNAKILARDRQGRNGVVHSLHSACDAS